jgi:hypothetical protein
MKIANDQAEISAVITRVSELARQIIWAIDIVGGVPPTFRTADQIRSDPERTIGIGKEAEILSRVS